MSGSTAALIAISFFFVLLVIRTPVAFALAATGAVGTVLVRGWDVANSTITSIPFQATARHALVIVPMFILMGVLAKHCRIVEDVFALAARYLRWLPGGLGVATVAACAAFAAVSGSSIASAAAVGRMAVDEMRRFGYSGAFAAGIVASAGTLGVMIPPSLMLVIYGILTGESIGRLLIAGIVPGLFSAACYAIWIVLRARRWVTPHGAVAPASTAALQPAHALADAAGGPSPTPVPPASATTGTARGEGAGGAPRTGRSQVGGLVRAGLLFLIVIGGLYSGIFTATESAAVGAFCAFVMLVLFHRRTPGRLWTALWDALRESASLSSMIFAIIIGATLFTFFLVSAGLPTTFAQWAASFPVGPTPLLFILLATMIPLGMFLDGVSVLVVATPFLYPVASAVGIDGVWFGVLTVKMVELGLITPPVGLNVYVVASSVPDLSVEDAFRGVMGFALVDLVIVVALVSFPAAVLWLPNLMRGA